MSWSPSLTAAQQGTAATITTPPHGSTLGGSQVTFAWSEGADVEQYFLYLGTNPEANDLYGQSQGLNRQVTVSGLPSDGSTIYIRIWSTLLTSGWVFVDTNVRAYTPTVIDDHGDTISASTTVETNTVIEGNLEFDGDVDVFSFNPRGGLTYRIATTLVTLNDSVLTLKNATNEVLSSNDDVESGVLSSLI